MRPAPAAPSLMRQNLFRVPELPGVHNKNISVRPESEVFFASLNTAQQLGCRFPHVRDIKIIPEIGKVEGNEKEWIVENKLLVFHDTGNDDSG